MGRSKSVVTPQRFASGMTFDEYVGYMATPENLAREGSASGPRVDRSAYFRTAYEETRLTSAQTAALRWLVAQPGGPTKVLAISEEWSSDCRRDIPAVARMAEVGGLELRIFTRDGRRFSASQRPSLADEPDSNADIMAEFLNEKDGQTWQSIPVVVFYTRELQYLCHYVEYAAMYSKDRIRAHQSAARPGETAASARARSDRAFADLQASPFFLIWRSAAIDTMLSLLYERLVVGSPA